MGEVYRAHKNYTSGTYLWGGIAIGLGNGNNNINIETVLAHSVVINAGQWNNSLNVENYNAIPENCDTKYDQYGIITQYHQTQRSDITMGNGDNTFKVEDFESPFAWLEFGTEKKTNCS